MLFSIYILLVLGYLKNLVKYDFVILKFYVILGKFGSS